MVANEGDESPDATEGPEIVLVFLFLKRNRCVLS